MLVLVVIACEWFRKFCSRLLAHARKELEKAKHIFSWKGSKLSQPWEWGTGRATLQLIIYTCSAGGACSTIISSHIHDFYRRSVHVSWELSSSAALSIIHGPRQSLWPPDVIVCKWFTKPRLQLLEIDHGCSPVFVVHVHQQRRLVRSRSRHSHWRKCSSRMIRGQQSHHRAPEAWAASQRCWREPIFRRHRASRRLSSILSTYRDGRSYTVLVQHVVVSEEVIICLLCCTLVSAASSTLMTRVDRTHETRGRPWNRDPLPSMVLKPSTCHHRPHCKQPVASPLCWPPQPKRKRTATISLTVAEKIAF